MPRRLKGKALLFEQYRSNFYACYWFRLRKYLTLADVVCRCVFVMWMGVTITLIKVLTVCKNR